MDTPASRDQGPRSVRHHETDRPHGQGSDRQGSTGQEAAAIVERDDRDATRHIAMAWACRQLHQEARDGGG